jgi:hypothetical protein
MDMTKSLLYVSRSLLEPSQATIEVERIVETSRLHNRRLGVTGVLIATNAGFAQVLEGDAASIDKIFGSIRRDARHEDVTVLSYEDIVRRQFEQWSLAYSGPSSYVAGHLEPLFGERLKHPVEADVRRLTKLMNEFGRSPRHAI